MLLNMYILFDKSGRWPDKVEQTTAAFRIFEDPASAGGRPTVFPTRGATRLARSVPCHAQGADGRVNELVDHDAHEQALFDAVNVCQAAGRLPRLSRRVPMGRGRAFNRPRRLRSSWSPMVSPDA